LNILLTGAGRRCQLIESFRLALNGRGNIFACDSSPDAPALRAADRWFIVPPVDHPDFIEKLFDICRDEHVQLLVPTFEPELPLLAEQRSRFQQAGTFVLISAPQVIETCYDKLATNRFLKKCGLPVLKTYPTIEAAFEALNRQEINFPLDIKPQWGFGSTDMEYPEDREELDLAYRLIKKRLARTFQVGISARDSASSLLIQEYLNGMEYGLDIINDFQGQYVCTVSKRKLRMRAGQTDRAITVKDWRLEALGAVIGKSLGHIGILDCDLIEVSGNLFVLDLNPRLGGGYPFSHLGGANILAALIAWADQTEPDPRWFDYEPGILSARSDFYAVLEKTGVDEGMKEAYQAG